MKIHMTVLMAVLINISWNSQVYAWSGETHKAFTAMAVCDEDNSKLDTYLKEQLCLNMGLNADLILNQTVLPESDKIPSKQLEDRIKSKLSEKSTVLDLLEVGADLEDIPNPRARHHFHDPYRNSGLENKKEHPSRANFANKMSLILFRLSFDLTGASNLDRALGKEAGQWEHEYINYFSWPDARDYFYKSLIDVNEKVREHYLALSFLSLGHVAHLLEDVGVPAHTRNDFVEAHFRFPKGLWNNPFESYVEDEIIKTSEIPDRWLQGWSQQAKVFPNLSYYWDINDYNGQYVGTSPLSYWGLSEQTNYQFLSKSTIFRENVIIDSNTGERTKYYFPHPDSCNVTGYVEPGVYSWNSMPVHYRYFSGYDITHLARTKYVEKYAYTAGMSYPVPAGTVVYHTTFDKLIYEDYAKVTIPRTIDYATGLLNYFFRGKLEIEPNCLDCNTVTFYIRNDSNNSGIPQTLKGGTFKLFWDTRDGNRTEVNDFTIPGWSSSSELAYNNYVTGTFNKPDSNEIEKYTVVYKGQISENPAQPDEDDSNAIAVATLKMGYPIIAWGRDVEGQVSDVPDGNDFVDVAAGKYHGLAIRSSGSLVAWGYNDYGQCNVPEGNDFIAIAGGSRHSLALRSDGSIIGFGDNALGQIDVPEGNDFIAIACGDYHNLAINEQGSVVGWGGYNTYGECDAPEPDSGTTFVVVSAGSYHSLGLQSDGSVRAWGSNTMGQTRIYDGAGNDHEAIAAGGNYSFLLLTDDSLVYWGGGDWYEPGIPDYHWRMDGNDYIAIAAGGFHIAALTNDGRILSWGYNNYDSPPYPVPSGITFVKDLAAGWKFTVALKTR